MAAENGRNGQERAGIGKRLVMALPLALGWIIYTAQPTPGNFLLGYIVSLLAVGATNFTGESFRLKNPPRQLYNLVVYTLFMAKEVLVAGITVASIALRRNLPEELDLLFINTQDSSRSELISAASAHGITITPGQLVVDFIEDADGVVMIVHRIIESETRSKLEAEQAKRLRRIKGILGLD